MMRSTRNKTSDGARTIAHQGSNTRQMNAHPQVFVPQMGNMQMPNAQHMMQNPHYVQQFKHATPVGMEHMQPWNVEDTVKSLISKESSKVSTNSGDSGESFESSQLRRSKDYSSQQHSLYKQQMAQHYARAMAQPQVSQPTYQQQVNMNGPQYRTQSSDSSSSGSGSSADSAESYSDDARIISDRFMPDPAREVAPKSRKMALGSITYSSDQCYDLGVFKKDNSFFLRVEKCDPTFCDRLSHYVEQANGFRAPRNVENQFEYWPEHALYNYCQQPNARLQRDMDAVYREWHDTRCGMDQLYGRLCDLKRRRQVDHNYRG